MNDCEHSWETISNCCGSDCGSDFPYLVDDFGSFEIDAWCRKCGALRGAIDTNNILYAGKNYGTGTDE